MVDGPRGVDVGPIRDEDVQAVGEFLHRHLNSRLSGRLWARSALPTWTVDAPNHGFLLRQGDDVVGVYLAFYSERRAGDDVRKVCNLAAWCVLEEHRAHGVRLVRAMLRQKGYDFVDLSPSGNVVDLNTRLGFEFLDTTSAMVPNVPLPSRRGVRVLTEPTDIEQALPEHELAVYRDHRHAGAAWHFVVQVGDESCYVVARRDRRKRMPVFATLLHVSDPAVLARAGHAPYRHLLLRHHTLVTLAEHRVAGRPPRLSRPLRAPRRRMYRSAHQTPASAIDYLYSELTCVPW
ncbi:hypothetical protein SAMN04489844_0542 [Nocardioides exalbidus]|uniref:N-acetyltransferase domain-containing protein n=1 Tax=Nocardioides exalbidus TaxID=402596 RepID=A0A1H4KE69_9ACTN|nr:hypothetical protein [Nocardioides exalbidus]SEB56556.1 hypothetical protein SAMN04489844_0542 [Nocardioides exalbidus]